MTNVIDKEDCGVVFVAFGDSYLKEVRESLDSLQRTSPSIKSCVITDLPWIDDPLPDHFIVRDPLYSFECKPKYIYDSPFTNTLFLDTDTYVARDIGNVFNLLKYYDIGVLFGGTQLGDDEIECHLQCSSSTILFRKNDVVEKVFSSWMEIYSSEKEIQPVDKDPRGLGDQRYLAVAIAKSSARPLHIGSHFNFILGGQSSTCTPPYVYTGRNVDYEWADYVLTDNWNPKEDWWERTWMANIKGVLPRGVRRSDPFLALALIYRRCVNEVKQKLWLLKR